MSDKENNELRAPSYVELYNLVNSLRDEIVTLRQSSAAPNSSVSNTSVSNTDRPAASIDYRLLPDVSDSVSVFTGHETGTVANDWVTSVEGLASVDAWPERYCLQYMRSKMSGAARNWFISEQFNDWNTALQRFRSSFVTESRLTDKWHDLDNRIQNKDEPTVDYFYSKLALCNALSLPFPEVRDHLLEGLRSQEQSDWVASRTHTNVSELLADFRDWKRRRDRRRLHFPSVPQQASTRTNVRPAVPHVPATTTKVSDSKSSTIESPAPVSNPKPSIPPGTVIKCYNYRGQGHISRDCPKPQRPIKCTNCASSEHRRAHCPLPPSRVNQAMHVDGLAFTTSRNPFSKHVLINDRQFTGLLTPVVRQYWSASQPRACVVLKYCRVQLRSIL